MGWFLAETVLFLKLMARSLEHILGNSKPKMGQLAIEIRITSGVVQAQVVTPVTSTLGLNGPRVSGIWSKPVGTTGGKTKLAAPPWWLRFPSWICLWLHLLFPDPWTVLKVLGMCM